MFRCLCIVYVLFSMVTQFKRSRSIGKGATCVIDGRIALMWRGKGCLKLNMPIHACTWKQYITVNFENAYQRPITHIYCEVEIFVVAGDQNTKIPIPR